MRSIRVNKCWLSARKPQLCSPDVTTQDTAPTHPPIRHRRCIDMIQNAVNKTMQGKFVWIYLQRWSTGLWGFYDSWSVQFPVVTISKCSEEPKFQRWIISTPASYLEGARCKLWPRDWFSVCTSCDCTCFNHANVGTFLKFGHKYFVFRPYQFIIHTPPCHLTLHSVKYWYIIKLLLIIETNYSQGF